MATLKVGPALYPSMLPEFEYKLDTKYSITITGAEADNLKLDPVKEEGKVNIDRLFDM